LVTNKYSKNFVGSFCTRGQNARTHAHTHKIYHSQTASVCFMSKNKKKDV